MVPDNWGALSGTKTMAMQHAIERIFPNSDCNNSCQRSIYTLDAE